MAEKSKYLAQLKKTAKQRGINELARLLNWQPGGIADSLAGRRPVSPYRAAQLASFAGDDAVAAALSALCDQARSEEEREFWRGLIEGKRRPPSYVDDVEVRKIVSDGIGKKYVFVVASGISRYLREVGPEKRTKTIVRVMAERAKALYDEFERYFEGGPAYPIDDRREMIKRYLLGEEEKVEADVNSFLILAGDKKFSLKPGDSRD